ncbi:MAG: hypothetical protein ACKVT0_10525 [Planctomycetaceae bacterium]
MYETYVGHGVRFRYPGLWAISETRQSHEVMIQVESGGTSFWSLTLLFDAPAPVDVIESVAEVFREEYEELDIYPVPFAVSADLKSQTRAASGCDIEFVSLEMVNSAFIRCFQTPRLTGVVLYQGTDHELLETRDQLEAITRSLSLISNEYDSSSIGKEILDDEIIGAVGVEEDFDDDLDRESDD